MKPERKPRAPRGPEIIGWREHIGLPDLGLSNLAAKIDTGARTSAIHAVELAIIDIDNARWVEFSVPVGNRRTINRVRALLVDEREIKNTSGVSERRLVVRTTLLMGRHRWKIEMSLANREKMEFDLILGRTAIRKRGILVDPGHSYVLGPPMAANKPAEKPRRRSSQVLDMEGEAE